MGNNSSSGDNSGGGSAKSNDGWKSSPDNSGNPQKCSAARSEANQLCDRDIYASGITAGGALIGDGVRCLQAVNNANIHCQPVDTRDYTTDTPTSDTKWMERSSSDSDQQSRKLDSNR